MMEENDDIECELREIERFFEELRHDPESHFQELEGLYTACEIDSHNPFFRKFKDVVVGQIVPKALYCCEGCFRLSRTTNEIELNVDGEVVYAEVTVKLPLEGAPFRDEDEFPLRIEGIKSVKAYRLVDNMGSRVSKPSPASGFSIPVPWKGDMEKFFHSLSVVFGVDGLWWL